MDHIAARPYYGDSYTWRFDATVVEATTVDGEAAMVLDASYFYPTSGGQPHDTGTLGPSRVVDVRIRDDDDWLAMRGGSNEHKDAASKHDCRAE